MHLVLVNLRLLIHHGLVEVVLKAKHLVIEGELLILKHWLLIERILNEGLLNIRSKASRILRNLSRLPEVILEFLVLMILLFILTVLFLLLFLLISLQDLSIF